MTRVYLSLGSNLEPEKHLCAALSELRAKFGDIVISPVYRFAAVGFDGPDFLNLAVGIDTDLDPVALNDWLHALEDRQGRHRDVPRFSSRTLDIDIVLYGDLVLNGPNHLELPRAELETRVRRSSRCRRIAPDIAASSSGARRCAQLWREHAGDVPHLVETVRLWLCSPHSSAFSGLIFEISTVK